MPDDGQELSPQDIHDLQDITTKLPPGHPMQARISTLINSQPTQFEKDRPGKGISTEGVGTGMWDTLGGLGRTAINTIKALGTAGDTGLEAGQLHSPRQGGAFDPQKSLATVKQMQAEDASRKEAGYSPVYRAAAQAAPLVGANPSADEADAARGEGGKILGREGTVAGLAVAPSLLSRALPAAKKVMGKVGDAIHDPVSGELTEGATRKSQLAGAAAGGVTGTVLHPGYGTVAGAAGGYKLAPSIMETLFPESEARTAPRAEAAKQALLDSAVKKAGIEARAAGRNAPGPYIPKEAIAAAKKSMAEPKQIISPDEAKQIERSNTMPPVNRELTNYPRETLFELAKKGDMAAIRELQRNPSKWGLPPNSIYLTGQR